MRPLKYPSIWFTHLCPVLILSLIVLLAIIPIISSQTVEHHNRDPARGDENIDSTEPIEDGGNERSEKIGSDEFEKNSHLSETDKKLLTEKLKQGLLKIIGLKDVPQKQKSKKTFIPRAILEKYMKTRDLVRDNIPDDRVFLGKLDVDHDIDMNHENFWNSVHDKYGSYGIHVNLENEDATLRNYRFRGEATDIRYVSPEGEPQDIPPRIEHTLPPHSRNLERHSFFSVHIKFNMSHELYTNQLAANDLRGAELYLNRERINYCGLAECDSSSTFQKTDINSSEGKESKNKIDLQRPRYQRIYILQLISNDSHGDMMTRIYESRRIDITETTPLVFDVFGLVKRWISVPMMNYGIIVRVTNDDDFQVPKDESSSNDTYVPSRYESTGVIEHVRLKRDFHQSSDSEEVWMQKRPHILLYVTPSSDSTGESSGHVKRSSSSEADSGEGQPDNVYSNKTPEGVSATQASQKQEVSLNASSQDWPKSVDGQTRREMPIEGNSVNKRNSRQAATGQTSRARANQLKSRGKVKCSRRSLTINFDEVGWTSWIIAPLAYNAHYCLGDCSYPIADSQNATNHAIIQSIFYSVGRVVPRSCCAPTKFSSMALLYSLDGVVQMKHYDDMIIESCGCL